MTWVEFKGLTREDQQNFIDEMGRVAPVNGAALARYFGINIHTMLKYLHANGLTANARPSPPMQISDRVRSLAMSLIQESNQKNGHLTPQDELKSLFIQSNMSPYAYEATNYCLRLTHDEEIFSNTDLCQFSTENLVRVFDNQFGVGVHTSEQALAVIKRYTEFCELLGAHTSKEIYEFKPDVYQKIRSRMVASPLHLSVRLQEAFGKLSTESADCLYHCMMWMAFAGVPQSTLPTITTNDIDFIKLHVRADDRNYPIYHESIDAFRYACQNTRFEIANAHGKYTRERVPGNILLRGLVNQNINTVSMLRYMRDRAKKNGVILNYSLIKRSGHFYRIYELERAGFTPDFAGLIAEKLERGTHIANISLIRRDYEAWKKAFG